MNCRFLPKSKTMTEEDWITPPVALASTVSKRDWASPVKLLTESHAVDVARGPGGFLELWDQMDPVSAFTYAAVNRGCGFWFNWDDDYLVQDHCCGLADDRLDWRSHATENPDGLRFVWRDKNRRGNVTEGLAAFDKWLEARNLDWRLLELVTEGDFHSAVLVRSDATRPMIQALAQAGVAAGLSASTFRHDRYRSDRLATTTVAVDAPNDRGLAALVG